MTKGMTETRRETPLISNFSLTLLVVACGGGGETATARIQSRMVIPDGRVVDGPIVGAIVYVDTNEKGRHRSPAMAVGSAGRTQHGCRISTRHSLTPAVADASGELRQRICQALKALQYQNHSGTRRGGRTLSSAPAGYRRLSHYL